MAEQTNSSFVQRCMQDFATGSAWVPTAGGPMGHARPQGSQWTDSPVLKLALDLVDWLRPDQGARGALRALQGDPVAQAQATVDGNALPALERVRADLKAEGYPVALAHDTGWVELRVTNFNGSELIYRVEGQVAAEPAVSVGESYASELRRYPLMRIFSWGRYRNRAPSACSERAIQRDCRYEMRKSLLW